MFRMRNLWPWKKNPASDAEFIEKRASGSGFTSEIIAARESYISGRRGISELTATAQSCVSLWEHGFCLADVTGTDLLDRRSLALIGRSLALRGEALFLIRETGLVPCADWDLSTRDGKPRSYRVSISEAGGGRSETALAGEVLHIRIGCDPAAPYLGSAPLRRASLTSAMLDAVERALTEVYENAPLGSMIVPFPETPDTDMTALGRSFRGQRGRVLLRESVNVSAAGGPAPASDWRPQDTTPNIEQAMAVETLAAARDAICCAFGVLPSWFSSQGQGPAIRECQRNLAQWHLAPIAALISEEASEKLGSKVSVDVMRPTQSWDAGGRARAFATLIEGMAKAREANIGTADIMDAWKQVAWE